MNVKHDPIIKWSSINVLKWFSDDVIMSSRVLIIDSLVVADMYFVSELQKWNIPLIIKLHYSLLHVIIIKQSVFDKPQALKPQAM